MKKGDTVQVRPSDHEAWVTCEVELASPNQKSLFLSAAEGLPLVTIDGRTGRQVLVLSNDGMPGIYRCLFTGRVYEVREGPAPMNRHEFARGMAERTAKLRYAINLIRDSEVVQAASAEKRAEVEALLTDAEAWVIDALAAHGNDGELAKVAAAYDVLVRRLLTQAEWYEKELAARTAS